MRSRPGRIGLLAVVLIVLGASCTDSVPSSTPTHSADPTLMDAALADGAPCEPPCWNGLVPGKSTYIEVLETLEQLRNGAPNRDFEIDTTWFVYYPGPGLEGLVSGTFKDGVLQRIHGSVDSEYIVGNLVDHFGPPEGVYTLAKGPVCNSCETWTPSPPEMNIPAQLLYPTQGLYFFVLVPLSGEGCLCPEMKAVTFCYYAPISMREALKDDYLADLCIAELEGVTEENLIEWQGFGPGYTRPQ